MQKEYFYLGIQLFCTFVNLYFMKQNRESHPGMANFSAFAAGVTFMGALSVMAGLLLG